MDMSLNKLQELMDKEAWCGAIMGLPRVRQELATEQNWAEHNQHSSLDLNNTKNMNIFLRLKFNFVSFKFPIRFYCWE